MSDDMKFVSVRTKEEKKGKEIRSEVKFYNGRPTLFIEGKPVPAMGYVTYLPERNSYKQFGDAGYRIFSVVTNFGGQPINTITNVGPMEPGIFREKGKENYSSFDKTVTVSPTDTSLILLILPQR